VLDLLCAFPRGGHNLLRLIAKLGGKALVGRESCFGTGDLLFIPRNVGGDLGRSLALDADLLHVLAYLLAARTRCVEVPLMRPADPGMAAKGIQPRAPKQTRILTSTSAKVVSTASRRLSGGGWSSSVLARLIVRQLITATGSAQRSMQDPEMSKR